MKLNTMLLSSKAVFALVISATLITSCSKGDLEYKRKKNPTPTPTEPTAPTSPTPTPTVGYLSLQAGTPQAISGRTNLVIENLRFENALGAILTISNSSNVIIRNCFFGRSGAEAIVLEG